MFYTIIREKTRQWRDSPDCPVASTLDYIRQRGALREPQVEAIETYLFLKIAGRGRSLATLFAEGFFNQPIDLKTLSINQIARDCLSSDPAAMAIFQFCSNIEKASGKANRGLAGAFERQLTKHAGKIDYAATIHEIFYHAEYADFLFSLPMGAGKTYLMAAFIYLDLYYALNEPENTAFARNFIVLAPSGLKSSIIPSLRTIENFDPSWVLPEPVASDIRKLIKFEVLDQPKSANKSNRARNPNSQKIAAHQPFADLTGLVIVVNAEKVILDRVEVDANQELIERNDDEKERLANELRHLIGTIPRMQVFIDEVQRAASASANIKLRAVVNKWCEADHISAVLGFSGTPYHDKPRAIHIGPEDEHIELRSSTIANTVYYYPLATAVAQFLKKPNLEVASGLQSLEIVRTGVQRFLQDYGNKTYANGACAKLAIYCGTIARLEQEIYPLLVGELGIHADRILKYHQGNKKYPPPKEAPAEFALLDNPISRKQIVLLVQIGKEGWDCRSLTGVILSQEGDCPRNMVLQTSCRCLRQVDGGPNETAFILLNESNYKVLDKQLGEEQNTSIRELNAIRGPSTEPTVTQRSRIDHLRLPPVAFYQLRIKYHIHKTTDPSDPEAVITAIDPDAPAFKTLATVTNRYLDDRHAAQNNAISRERSSTSIDEQYGALAAFSAWLNQILRESLGDLSAADLRPFRDTLRSLFLHITFAATKTARRYNTLFNQSAIRSAIRLAFHAHRELETREEVIRHEAALLLVNRLREIPIHALLWPDQAKSRAILQADTQPNPKPVDPAVIEAKIADLRKTAADLGNPDLADLWIRQLHEAEATRVSGLKDKDRTLHYIPYDFRQSKFERDFIQNALTRDEFKSAGIEIYYNGDRHLTEFQIECYARLKPHNRWRRVGRYTPDFLVVNRQDGRIHKVLIIETKGSGFADQPEFVARRQFVENEFIPLNNKEFGYERFDFLYLRDDKGLARNLAALGDRVKTFFTES